MSSKLVPVSRRELIRRLGDLGFVGPYVGSGHEYMVKGTVRITIPNVHKSKEIGVGLLAQVLKEAGISRDEWFKVA